MCTIFFNYLKVNVPTPWKDMLSTGPLWAIIAAHIGASITYMLFFVDLPTYLERAMQISLRNVSYSLHFSIVCE